jgi:hypothetical protein
MKKLLFIVVTIWATFATALLFAQNYIYDGESFFEGLGAKVIKNYEKILYDGFKVWGEGGIGIDLPHFGKVDYIIKLSYITEKQVTIFESGRLHTEAVIIYNPQDGKSYLLLGADVDEMANDFNKR